MTVWSSYSWAPRTECGSWCSLASRRLRSAVCGRRCGLVRWLVCVISSLPTQQVESLVGGHLRHVHYMGDRLGRVQANVIRLSPLVFVAGDLVAHPEPVVGLHPERRHVQPERRLLWSERVQCHYHQHLVAGRRVELAVGQQGFVVGMVELDRAQLMQSRVHPANLV